MQCYLCLLCVFMFIYVHITFVNIWCVSVYFGMFIFNLCLCSVKCIVSPQHEIIHPMGMEVIANVIETCERKQGKNYR